MSSAMRRLDADRLNEVVEQVGALAERTGSDAAKALHLFLTWGPIDETEGMSRLAGDPESRKKVESTIPMQRLGTKDDIANVALFLASDAASYITGSIYACDGGMQLMGGAFMTM